MDTDLDSLDVCTICQLGTQGRNLSNVLPSSILALCYRVPSQVSLLLESPMVLMVLEDYLLGDGYSSLRVSSQ